MLKIKKNVYPNERGYFLTTLLIMLPFFVFGTYLVFQLIMDNKTSRAVDKIVDRAAFAGATQIDTSALPSKLLLNEIQAKRFTIQMIYKNFGVPSDEYLKNIDKANYMNGVPQKSIPLPNTGAEFQIMGVYVVNIDNPGVKKKWFEYIDPWFTLTKQIDHSSVVLIARLDHQKKAVGGNRYEYMFAIEELRWKN